MSFSGYRRIVGSIGWPKGGRPGVAIIIGEDHILDKEAGRRPLYILDEVEKSDLIELYEQCFLFQREHGPDEWIGNCSNPLISIFQKRNQMNQVRNKPEIRIEGIPEAQNSNAFAMTIEIIMQRLHTGKKSLFFGKSSFLPGRLPEIGGADGNAPRIDDYPAIAALGYAVSYLDLNEPVRARSIKSVHPGGWT